MTDSSNSDISSANGLRRLRRDIVDMAGHSAHVAAALSCVDILAALYSGVLRVDAEDRDIFILSKGHGAMALYAVLAERGIINRELLATYGQDGSLLAEHPLAGKLPGVEFAAGSLGHGLPVAAGMAKAFLLQNRPSRVFVLMGDGECDEGSVWEAAGAARAQQIDNLTALVDWNNLQACGPRDETTYGYSLPECWRGFGWEVIETDGHDVQTLREILSRPNAQKQPRVVLCRTVKGKGIPFMENNLEWHYRPVRGKEREEALRWLADA